MVICHRLKVRQKSETGCEKQTAKLTTNNGSRNVCQVVTSKELHDRYTIHGAP